MNRAAGDNRPAEERRGRRRTDTAADAPERPALEVCVRGRDTRGEDWVEVTRMLDATHSGASFVLARQPRLGQLLHITLPPPKGTAYSRTRAPEYGGRWSLVWAISPQAETDAAPGVTDSAPRHKVSVTYVGSDVPRRFVTSAGRDFGFEFEEDGGVRLHERLALVGGASARDRRRRGGTRLPIPIEITLEVIDDEGSVVESEATVTENISCTGAAVWTALSAEPGTRLRMTSAQQNVTVLAVVRHRRAGADGITRLHLEFVDDHWPLEGLR